jgi:hypothetical protein
LTRHHLQRGTGQAATIRNRIEAVHLRQGEEVLA